MKTFSDPNSIDLINFLFFLYTDDVHSIYDGRDALGVQEEEGAVQGADKENAAHGPITDKMWTISSKGMILLNKLLR